jgi:hypothetical protein
MEQIQQELIRSNEMLATQVWVLGGLIRYVNNREIIEEISLKLNLIYERDR